MARTVATLPAGSRITDYISLGAIAKTFPVDKIHSVLAATGAASVRQRDLPAHVVVYDVLALAIYMQPSYREVLRCSLEGVSNAYVARRHLAMPAITDYWINDRSGDPLLVVTGEVDAALTKALPRLLREVREVVGERRVTIVFDRGGWSPNCSAR